MIRPPPFYTAFCVVVILLFTYAKVEGLAPWSSGSSLRGSGYGSGGSYGSSGSGGYGYAGVSGASHK